MRYLVLTTWPEDNPYGEIITSYSCLQCYLSFFRPLEHGEEIMSVLYELSRGRGQQSYVGWKTLQSPAQRRISRPARLFTVLCEVQLLR